MINCRPCVQANEHDVMVYTTMVEWDHTSFNQLLYPLYFCLISNIVKLQTFPHTNCYEWLVFNYQQLLEPPLLFKRVTYLMCFCYRGFTKQVFTLMFWGYVWFLTKTRTSTYTHIQITLKFRFSLIIIPMFVILLPLNSMQECIQTSLEPNRMILILLRHLYEELILWAN